MKPAARRVVARLPRERRVEDIMVAARHVFEEKGYADAAIAEIAERANVVEGTIYRYFENKRELLVRVVERWYESMLADFDAHLRKIATPRERLRYLIWRHLWTIHREPALCRLVFSELRPSADYRDTKVFALNRAYTQGTVDILREGIAAGELRDDVPVSLVRDMIYGSIEHHTWEYLRGEGDFAVESTADAITDVIWRGLAATPGAGRAADAGAIPDAVARLEAVAGRLELVSAALPARKNVSQGTGRKSR